MRREARAGEEVAPQEAAMRLRAASSGSTVGASGTWGAGWSSSQRKE